jgi:succinate dehydrogenase/fumarate reductase cytochrome b subunit
VLHKIHRLSASIIGLYALIHILNHLVALRGVDSHIAFMQGVRAVLRIPLVEALLLACVVVQIGSGLYFVARRWGEREGLFDRLQALSGAYLAFFLLIHVSSVLAGRFALGLDTNFYFAAAGLHIAPYPLFFIPYYGLAVMALVVHVTCAFHYLGSARFAQNVRDRFGYLGVAGAVALAVLIVATFSGAFYSIDIPPEYRSTFSGST